MGRRRAAAAPRRPVAPSRPLLVAGGAVVTVALVAAGTLGGGSPGGGGSPAGSAPGSGPAGPSAGVVGTPAADSGRIDVSDLPIAREPFCDRIDDSAVPTALGRQVGTRRHYASGDRVRLTDGLTDVSHEHGCVFGAGDAEARAWVFAAPVRTPLARDLVGAARSDPSCSYPGGGPGFGSPGLSSVCNDEGTVEVTHRGLFGDAWLSCRLTLPGADPASAKVRTDRWCLHVATTLGAGD